MRVRAVRDLAAAVKGRRRDLGMSQAILAARAGVSRKWVYEFEAGKPAAELRLIMRVLDALGLALSVDRDDRQTDLGDRVDLDTVIEEYRAR